jgi:hypothetical protein
MTAAVTEKAVLPIKTDSDSFLKCLNKTIPNYSLPCWGMAGGCSPETVFIEHRNHSSNEKGKFCTAKRGPAPALAELKKITN